MVSILQDKDNEIVFSICHQFSNELLSVLQKD